MNKNEIMPAVAEYAAIVDGIATDYDNTATVETIRKDHPELDFMDDDEITELLNHAKTKHEQKKEVEPMPTIYERMTAELETLSDRSAWNRGVTAYALELVESLTESANYNGRDPESGKECREWLLNGAQDWEEFSYGGSALIYDGDIAERLCTPSELKKTRNGERNPNNRETWLDTQARALNQACSRVTRLYRHIMKEG